MWFYLVRCPRQSICCKQEDSSAKVTLGFSLAFVFFCILRCPPIPSKSEFRFGFGGGAPCTSLSVDPAGSRESESGGISHGVAVEFLGVHGGAGAGAGAAAPAAVMLPAWPRRGG
jgi:hypothetical protein